MVKLFVLILTKLIKDTVIVAFLHIGKNTWIQFQECWQMCANTLNW